VRLSHVKLRALYKLFSLYRTAIAFYCIGSLDLLGSINPNQKEEWREWIWEQYASGPWGSGFRPSEFMSVKKDDTARTLLFLGLFSS
jgi:hypothetical protein